MFFKKCDKKTNPLIAIVIGTLAVVGAFTVKKSGMQFIKEKWSKMTSFIKNMPMCCGIFGGNSGNGGGMFGGNSGNGGNGESSGSCGNRGGFGSGGVTFGSNGSNGGNGGGMFGGNGGNGGNGFGCE